MHITAVSTSSHQLCMQRQTVRSGTYYCTTVCTSALSAPAAVTYVCKYIPSAVAVTAVDYVYKYIPSAVAAVTINFGHFCFTHTLVQPTIYNCNATAPATHSTLPPFINSYWQRHSSRYVPHASMPQLPPIRNAADSFTHYKSPSKPPAMWQSIHVTPRQVFQMRLVQ